MKKSTFLLLIMLIATTSWQMTAQIVTIGTGTSTNIYPLGNYYGYERSASIYTLPEFGNTGTISTLGWYAEVGGLGARPIKIYLKETTATSYTSPTGNWTNKISGATLVYDNSLVPVAGWNTLVLSTPFVYNSNNLEVLVEANFGLDGNGSQYGNEIRYTVVTYSHAHWREDYSAPTGNGTITSNRPNIQIDFTPITCTPPSALTTTAITPTTADVSWTQGSSETAWNISWGAPGYTPGTGHIGTGTVSAPNPLSYHITSLTPDTFYDVYVQANCGGDLSMWVGPMPIFTGYCISVPSSVDNDGLSTLTVGNKTYPSTGSGITYEDFTGQTPVDLMAGLNSNVQITFATGYTYNTNIWIDLNDNQVFESTELLFQGESLNDYPTTLDASFIMPSSATLGNHRMRIGTADEAQGTPNPCYNGSYGLTVDLIVNVLATPSCLPPTGTTISAITSTTANVSWTGNGESNWNISWGTSGYTIGGAGEKGTNSPTAPNYTITSGLLPNTEYEFYVQANCGSGDLSPWTVPVLFKTLCSPEIAPWTEGFENGGNIPTCWTQGVGNGKPWNFSNSASGLHVGNNGTIIGSTASNGYFAWVDDSNPEYTNTTMITPFIDVSALTVPELSFYLISNNEGYNNVTFSVDVFDGATWNNAVFTNNGNTHNGGWEEIIVSLSSLTITGDIQIRFVVNDVNNNYYDDVAIDDISVHEKPLCAKPTSLIIDGITSTTADISWNGNGGTNWNISWGNPGYGIGGTGELGTGNATAANFQITGLSFNSYYDIYVQGNCGSNQSPWIGPLSAFIGFCTPTTTGNTSYIESFSALGGLGKDIYNSNTGAGLNGSGYSDFTSQTLVAGPGGTINYAVTIESSESSGLKIWVDWNNDLVFHETLERVYRSTSYSSVHSGSFTIPGNASGKYRMRIGATYSPSTGPNDPCGHNNHGEYEDYTLDVPKYVYSNGNWYPSDPSGVSTLEDDILIMNGTGSLNANTVINNIYITSGATLEIHKILNLNGDIINNGNLVFISTATSNGELAQVSNTSSITGNATVQRYMKDKRSYRMVSSPVTTLSSIHDNWQESATSATHNPNQGFGTHITGSKTGDNGFDATITGNPSMFTVNVATQQFIAIANTNVNTLTAGTPYLLFVRGNRSINLGDDSAHSQTILRATGSLFSGTQNQNFASEDAGDFVMFGNPYQSTVDVKTVFANSTNINPAHYYVYDSELGANGAYVTINLTGAGNGTNTSGSAANKYLQPGQGAQAATLASGPSAIVFNEADKSPGNFTSSNRNPMLNNNMLTVQLYTSENFNNGGPVHDSFGILFDNENDNNITSVDAVKPMNFYENIAIDHNGTYLSLEQRGMPQPSDVYPLFSSGYKHSNYILKMNIEGLEDSYLYLDDAFTGTSTLLEVGETAYNFSVDNSNALSIATNRFSISVAQRLGVNDNNLLSSVRIYPNPLNSGTLFINAPHLNGERLLVNISDLSGRRIFEKILDCQGNTITVQLAADIASGVYMVTLQHNGTSKTYRLIKE